MTMHITIDHYFLNVNQITTNDQGDRSSIFSSRDLQAADTVFLECRNAQNLQGCVEIAPDMKSLLQVAPAHAPKWRAISALPPNSGLVLQNDLISAPCLIHLKKISVRHLFLQMPATAEAGRSVLLVGKLERYCQK